MKVSTQEYPASSYDLARPLKRLFALVIDVSIAYLILTVGMFAVRMFSLFLPSLSSPWLYGDVELGFVALAFIYFLFGDALPGGQTLGKRVMKIAVVGFPYETKCTPLQSVLRNVPKMVFSLLDSIFIFFGYRRRLGDMLASTIVINTKRTAS